MATIVDFRVWGSVEHQAREWLIRMDGDEPLSDTERQALREWMNRSAFHQAELTRLAHFWKQANLLADLASPFGASWSKSRQGAQGLLRFAMASSAALFFAALLWWGVQRLGAPVSSTYATVRGQQKTVYLSDGSSIQLNTDSQVVATYDRASRRIRLLRGEALFSVTTDPSRPFEVVVGDRVVRAIGTAFALYVDGTRIDLTVTNGVVDVVDRRAQAMAQSVGAPTISHLGRLKAGETTRMDSGSRRIEVHHLAGRELERRMAWREGYLVFSGAPLSEVVAQLNRYLPVRLEIGNPKLASVVIGGRFRISDLDSVLEVLITSFGLRAQLLNGTIRLEPAAAQGLSRAAPGKQIVPVAAGE